MSQPIEVASFWTGSSLSFFELVCIKSFVDQGYNFHLYTLGPVGNVPDYVQVHDANDIFSGSLPNSEDVRFNAGVYSDVFRAYLMRKTEYLWADLDVYCARPLDSAPSHIFGVVYRRRAANNCVLRLPANSPALQLIINFYNSEVPIPFWWPERRLKPLLTDYEAGVQPALGTLPWTTTGPGVLGWALRTTGELALGQSWKTYFQYQSALNFEFLQTSVPIENYEPGHVRFVHLYGATKIHIRDVFDGVPPPGSYKEAICARHGVDPATHPIPAFNATPQPVAARAG